MNDELKAIAEAFDDLLEASLPMEQLLESASTDTPDAADVRAALTDMGFAAIALPEDLGGFGRRPDWIAVLMQVAGRRLMPTALRDEALILVPLLAEAAERGDEQAGSWLAELQEGTITGAAGALLRGPDSERVEAHGGEFACDGVPIWAPADAGVVALLTSDGAWIFDAKDPRVRLDPVHAIDSGQAAARLTVEAGPVPETRRFDEAAVAELVTIWQLAVLAEAVGCADRATEMAVEYAIERRQFDRPIATFQSVAHLLADMKQRTELGRSVLSRLVSLMQRDASREVEDLLAAGRSWIPGAAREVCETGIQVHGGMGFTWEMGLHLWYRRALQIQAVLGGSVGAASAAGSHFVDRAREAAGTNRDDTDA